MTTISFSAKLLLKLTRIENYNKSVMGSTLDTRLFLVLGSKMKTILVDKAVNFNKMLDRVIYPCLGVGVMVVNKSEKFGLGT
jgi:hypothetical protein